MSGITAIANVGWLLESQANLFLKIRTVSITRSITLLAILSPPLPARFANITIMLAGAPVRAGVVGALFLNLIVVADFFGNRRGILPQEVSDFLKTEMITK